MQHLLYQPVTPDVAFAQEVWDRGQGGDVEGWDRGVHDEEVRLSPVSSPSLCWGRELGDASVIRILRLSKVLHGDVHLRLSWSPHALQR